MASGPTLTFLAPDWVVEEAKRLNLDHTNPAVLGRLYYHYSVCSA